MRKPTSYKFRFVILVVALGLSQSAFASCAPELDPGSLSGGLALLAASVALILGKRRRH